MFDLKVDPAGLISQFGKINISENALCKIREFVCFAQGGLSQYFLNCGRSFFELKFLVSMNATGDDIKEKKKELDLLKSKPFYENFKNEYCPIMQDFFKEVTSEKPRISIKSTKDNGKFIVTLIRDIAVEYDSECEVAKNLGFLHVHDYRVPFFCNDLPAQVANGDYSNPRINFNNAIKYNNAGYIKRLRRRFVGKDTEWQKVWDMGNTPIEQCYKSTLIVPMTLNSNRGIDSNFIDYLQQRQVDPKNSSFGFLCFDHYKANFFPSEKMAIECGFIFADILSLYLLTDKLITNSDTYKAASILAS